MQRECCIGCTSFAFDELNAVLVKSIVGRLLQCSAQL